MFKGVYKLERDTLTVHFGLNKARPKDFADTLNGQTYVMIFQRTREKKE
jgi:hypothetical protein